MAMRSWTNCGVLSIHKDQRVSVAVKPTTLEVRPLDHESHIYMKPLLLGQNAAILN